MRLAKYLLFLLIVSCKSVILKDGNKFIYENEFLKRELNFINDSICEFKQEYKCEDLDEKYNNFKIVYKYFLNDTVILTSKNKKLNLKLLQLKKTKYKDFNFREFKYIEIPIQNSKCYFLNDESREVLTDNITYDEILKIKRKMTIYESTNRIYDLDAFSLLFTSKNKMQFKDEVYKLSQGSPKSPDFAVK